MEPGEDNKNMTQEFSRRLLLAGAGAAIGTGLRPAGAQAAALKPLYDAARAAGETQLVVYLPAAASYRPFFDGFMREFPGITVQATDMFGAALFARLEAEQASGKPQADMVISGDIDFPTLSSRNWLRAYAPAGTDRLPPQYVGADGKWIIWALTVIGPTVNTTTLPDPGVQSWADLTKPGFRGKIAMTSPTTLTASPMALIEAMDARVIDQAWLDAFAALQPAVLNSSSAVMQAVATGQYAMTPFGSLIVVENARRQGAPVRFIYLKDGHPVVPTSSGVLASAPHPKAAELFASWLLGETSQKISAELGQIGTPPGSPTPAGYPPGTKLYMLTGDAMQTAAKAWFAGPAKTLAR
jgi:iron(III) transport system substrate-binding protein